MIQGRYRNTTTDYAVRQQTADFTVRHYVISNGIFITVCTGTAYYNSNGYRAVSIAE